MPVRQAVEASYTSIISLTRGLRNSGSDILVEEDLATYFGRARIDPVLEKQFKETILQGVGPINFTPIHPNSERSDSTRALAQP